MRCMDDLLLRLAGTEANQVGWAAGAAQTGRLCQRPSARHPTENRCVNVNSCSCDRQPVRTHDGTPVSTTKVRLRARDCCPRRKADCQVTLLLSMQSSSPAFAFGRCACLPLP